MSMASCGSEVGHSESVESPSYVDPNMHIGIWPLETTERQFTALSVSICVAQL
jgi:hypothetical protein